MEIRTALPWQSVLGSDNTISTGVHQRLVSEVHDWVVAYPQGGQLHEYGTWSTTPHLLLTANWTKTEMKTSSLFLYCTMFSIYMRTTHMRSHTNHTHLPSLIYCSVLSLFSHFPEDDTSIGVQMLGLIIIEWLERERTICYLQYQHLATQASTRKLINPRRMCEGYSSHSVCVCVCVSVSCYIPGLYDANKVPLGFLWHFQGIHCVRWKCFIWKFWWHLLTTIWSS